MPEFSHHIGWMREIEERLAQSIPVTDDERKHMIATCERVLSQNAESGMATSLLARIKGITTTIQSSIITLSETPKEKIARKINEVEDGMESLASRMVSKLDGARSPELKRALMNPFVFIHANRSNPFKNQIDLEETAAKGQIPSQALALSLQDPRHFIYNVVPRTLLQSQGAIIGTNAIGRMLAMEEGYDLSKTFAQLTVYHEMVHLMHHARQRQRNMDAFISFHANQGQRKVIINEEFDAYGLGLEGMNLLLDDQLLHEGERGNAVDPALLMERLEMQPFEEITAQFLSRMAQEYFGGNGHIAMGRYPEGYTNFVRQTLIHDGYTIYEYGQRGVPAP